MKTKLLNIFQQVKITIKNLYKLNGKNIIKKRFFIKKNKLEVTKNSERWAIKRQVDRTIPSFLIDPGID
jgi:hypothetical protein